MRAFVRPLLLFTFLVAYTAVVHSQPGGGVNQLTWNPGSPAPTSGGVDTSVSIKPTAGYVCTECTIRVIDATTLKTLDSYTVENPGKAVTKSFTGLGSGTKVDITVDCIFQSGGTFDFKDLLAQVTTK